MYVIVPASTAVSTASAKPFAPYGPNAIALATPVVEYTPVPAFNVVLIIVPLVKTPFTPDSFASGHPSPSESKSKRLGIPSPSVSNSDDVLLPQEFELIGKYIVYPAHISVDEVV